MSQPHGSDDCDDRCPEHGGRFDSLEAALRAVPWKWVMDGQANGPTFVFKPKQVPDYPALASVARRWIMEHMPQSLEPAVGADYKSGYTDALNDAARRLGLLP